MGNRAAPVRSKPDMLTAEEHPAAQCILEYFAAFQAGDSKRYAAQWLYPASLWAQGRWTQIASAAEMEHNNIEYQRAQRAAGIKGGAVISLSCEDLAPGAALVRGRFSKVRSDGHVAGFVDATYTVLRIDEVWKVAVCIA